MTHDDDTQRWLDVLAGRAEPTDAETRRAAALRQVILHQDHQVAPVNEATRTRMLERLRARGAFTPPPTLAQRWWQTLNRLQAWLLPPGGMPVARFAALALVLAVVAAPLWLPRDEGVEIKGSAAETVIHSVRPEQDAAAVLDVLSRHGITGQLARESGDTLVEAQIPADRLAQVQGDLVNLGLAAPADGQLKLRFRKRS